MERWTFWQVILVFVGAALVAGLFTACSNDKKVNPVGLNIPGHPSNAPRANQQNRPGVSNGTMGFGNTKTTASGQVVNVNTAPSGAADDDLRDSLASKTSDASLVSQVSVTILGTDVSVAVTATGKNPIFLKGALASDSGVLSAALKADTEASISGKLVCADVNASACNTRLIKLQVGDGKSVIYVISRLSNADYAQDSQVENQNQQNAKKILDVVKTDATKTVQVDTTEIIGGPTTLNLLIVGNNREIIPAQGALVVVDDASANSDAKINSPLTTTVGPSDALDADGKAYLTDLQKTLKSAQLLSNDGRGSFQIVFTTQESNNQTGHVGVSLKRQALLVREFKELSAALDKSLAQ